MKVRHCGLLSLPLKEVLNWVWWSMAAFLYIYNFLLVPKISLPSAIHDILLDYQTTMPTLYEDRELSQADEYPAKLAPEISAVRNPQVNTQRILDINLEVADIFQSA